jgi:hypothetical protein
MMENLLEQGTGFCRFLFLFKKTWLAVGRSTFQGTQLPLHYEEKQASRQCKQLYECLCSPHPKLRPSSWHIVIAIICFDDLDNAFTDSIVAENSKLSHPGFGSRITWTHRMK